MASNWPPVKNAAFTMGFFIYKSDGTIIANPTLTGSNVHTDLGTTEVTNSTLAVVDATTGLCSIALAQGTMNGDQIDGTITSSSTGAVVYTFKLMTAAQTLDTTDTAVDAAVTDIGAVHTHAQTIIDDVAAVHVHAQAIIDDVALVHTHAGNIDTNLGTPVNTGGTATVGAILGDFANSALVTRVADLHTDVADVHTDVAAVKAETVLIVEDTGTTIPATLAAFATTADVADAVADEALSGHATAGTVGKGITDLLTDVAAVHVHAGTIETATVGTTIGAAVKTAVEAAGSTLALVHTDVDAILVDTGTDIPASFAALADDTDVAAAVAANATIAAAIADVAATHVHAAAADTQTVAATVAASIWDHVLHTDHETSGSASVLLQASGGAADPWATAIPGAYGAGTAGLLLGTTIPTNVADIHTDVGTAITAIGDVHATDLPAVHTHIDSMATILTDIHDTDLPAVKTVVDGVEVHVHTTIPGTITTMQGNVTSILEDTGTTIPATLAAFATTADVADAVLDEAVGAHTGAIAEILTDTAVIGALGAGLTALATATAVADIHTDVATLTTTVGAAGVGLTAVALADTTSDAVIAGAVWDAAVASYGVADSYGAQAERIPSIEAKIDIIDDYIDTEVAAILAAVDTEVAAILADTNELQTDWTDGGRLDVLLDGATAPSAASVADAVWNEAAADHTTASTFGKYLGGAPAGATLAADVADIHTDVADLHTDVGTVHTDVDAILEDTSTTLDGLIDSVLADTGELQTDWANGGRLDLLLDGAASAGDPWSTTIPAAYGAGTAGHIIGNLPTLATAVDSIWDETVAAHTSATTFGLYLGGAPSGATLAADVADLHTDVGTAAADVAAVHVHAENAEAAVVPEVATIISNIADLHTDVGTAITDIGAVHVHVADIVADTNELQAEFADGGRLDLLIDAAASAGDPWSTTLPGAYTAGKAGYIIGGIPSGVTLTAAGIDAIYDEATSGHTTAGSFGKMFTLLRKLLFNKSVENAGSTSVEFYDDNDSTSLGTAAWDETNKTRGKNTVTW